MKKVIVVIIVLAGLAAAQDWTQFGFKAEPGVAVGTPCALNLMARFWYRNFGISTCGFYLPQGFNYLHGIGGEANVMYKLMLPRQPVQPYVALGYGSSDVATTISGAPSLRLQTQYAGLQFGAYYLGAFAQVGIGYGRFAINSSRIPIMPLIQIGYVGSIGGSGGNIK